CGWRGQVRQDDRADERGRGGGGYEEGGGGRQSLQARPIAKSSGATSAWRQTSLSAHRNRRHGLGIVGDDALAMAEQVDVCNTRAERTCSARPPTAGLCQRRKSPLSFDHLVATGEHLNATVNRAARLSATPPRTGRG